MFFFVICALPISFPVLIHLHSGKNIVGYHCGGLITNPRRDSAAVPEAASENNQCNHTKVRHHQTYKDVHWCDANTNITRHLRDSLAIDYRTSASTSTRPIYGFLCPIFASCLLCCSIHPGDLFPFTRRPLFLIVESGNSSAFSVCPFVRTRSNATFVACLSEDIFLRTSLLTSMFH